MKYNPYFDELKSNYIFADLRRIAEKKKSEGIDVVDLGIGDISLPLFTVAVEAMKKGSQELGEEESFIGYPPAEGLLSLRQKISEHYFKQSSLRLTVDEIFVNDGAKSELGDLLDLFARPSSVLIPTPSYPVYAEVNILAGNKITFLPSYAEDDFIPSPPFGKKYDVIYLCSPNNPTGTALDRHALSLWIKYALDSDAVIIFDGAYADFRSKGEPYSIYEINGAKSCAIEVRSFSKSFGFTGVRCGWTVIPKELGKCNELWKRRLGCKFNGVSVISQKGAEAFFSPDGQRETKKIINYYKNNAEIIKIAFKNKNLWYNSSCSSPYVFAKTPNGVSSTEFCEKIISELGVILTPGNAFGLGGEGFFRASAFPKRETILKATDKFDKRGSL